MADIDSISFPTWTDANGQDDIVWYDPASLADSNCYQNPYTDSDPDSNPNVHVDLDYYSQSTPGIIR